MPQAQFAILSTSGDTVQTFTGALASGLRRVYWNFRPRVEPEPKSPSELRDSVENAKLMREVADSLIAAGEDAATVERAVEQMSSGAAGFRSRFGVAGCPDESWECTTRGPSCGVEHLTGTLPWLAELRS